MTVYLPSLQWLNTLYFLLQPILIRVHISNSNFTIIICYCINIANNIFQLEFECNLNEFECRYVMGGIKCEAIAKTVSKPSWI